MDLFGYCCFDQNLLNKHSLYWKIWTLDEVIANVESELNKRVLSYQTNFLKVVLTIIWKKLNRVIIIQNHLFEQLLWPFSAPTDNPFKIIKYRLIIKAAQKLTLKHETRVVAS